MYRHYGKRLLDLVVAVPVLLFLSPLFVFVALLVRLDSPGPVLFTQERLGREGRTFLMVKFRTMTDRPRVPDREIVGHDPEVTRIGRLLRRFKIDELVQLVNVIKGDMSLVGPRPALPRQLGELDENGRRRLQVRPGLTGLAQINGNIHLSWPERWLYDAQYVKELSLSLDILIIVQTIAVVLLGEDKFFSRPSHNAHDTSTSAGIEK